MSDSLNSIASKPNADRAQPERNQFRWYFLENAAADQQTRDSWKRLTALAPRT